MHNLFRLSSLASLEGYYYKPRIDRELLQTYAKGLIATTGCPSRRDPDPAAARAVRRGACARPPSSATSSAPDNFFCELMDHGLEIERRVRADLLRLAKDLDLPLVATNDLHYTHAEDAKAHEVLLCVQSGTTLADPNRFKFDADDFYLKIARGDAPALARAARGLRQHAADRRALRRVASPRARADFMPRFPCPAGETEESWFVKEVERGLRGATPAASPDDARSRRRLRDRGHRRRWATRATSSSSPTSSTGPRSNGIRVGPGRGSGAGLDVRLRDAASPTSTRSSTG